MATATQITANRANAQQSTGPKTPEGIENCKYNATRHGLTGNQIVIQGEDPAKYDAFHLAVINEYQPASEIDAVLVEHATRNWWRLQRAQRMEADVIDTYGPHACCTDLVAAKAFQNIHRYLRTIERSWLTAVDRLDKIKAERDKAAAEAAAAAAVLPANVPTIGSVSQQPVKLVEACSTPKPSASASTPSKPTKSEPCSPHSGS